MSLSKCVTHLAGRSRTQLPVLMACTRAMSTKYDINTLEKDNFLGLKRLPIPTLDETFPKYLRSIEPILTAEELKKAEQEVADFIAGPGKVLQATALKEDAHEGYPYSYIQKHWDDMYLTIRCSHPVNVSPYFKLVDDPSKGQFRRAAEFALAYVRWTRKILAGALEPCPGGKGAYLCHSGYKFMIGMSKSPRKDRDVVELYPESRTLTVISKGNLCSIEVLTEAGEILSVEALEKQLAEIAAAPAAKTPICVLTSEDRDVWAATREKLASDPANAAALGKVDQGIFTVVLEDAEAGDRSAMSRSLLHGNPANRWYDKHQLVAYKDGKMGLVLEHSMSDGMNWTRFVHEVMADVSGSGSLPPGCGPLPQLPTVTGPIAMPTPLHFKVSDEVAKTIAVAEANYKTLADSVDHDVLELPFGKDTLKSWKVSPDAAMQVAYMAAFYKVHGAMPPVYESCTTRRFFVGRTETIRSCTPEAKALAQAVAAGETGPKLLGLLRKAGETHVGVSRDAVMAMGSDRHMMVLNYLANRDMKGNMPAVFTNPALAASKNWLISSSNATSTPYIDQFGFGPTAGDGYGLGYLIEANSVKLAVTSFKGSKSKGSATFIKALTEVLDLFKAEAAKEQ